MPQRSASPRLVVLGLAAGAATACTQGGLDPRGSEAARIFDVTLWLTIAGTAVFLVVVVSFVWAVVRRREGASPRAEGTPDTPLERRFVVGGGIVMPAVVLAGFFGVQIWSTVQQPQSGELEIEVVGHQYWWEVNYPAVGDAGEIVTANQVNVPVGRDVTIVLRSDDVIHSFWAPALAGKVDLTPGRINRFTFSVDEPGTYEGYCAEYCGLQHAWMKFEVVAMEQADFERWAERMSRPAVEPADDLETRGREVFLENSCVGCHDIRGVAEQADVGPDLTHLASRDEIGAGVLPLDEDNLRVWVVNTQSVKPGAQMPPQQLTPEDLDALLAYLMSLE